MTVYIVDTNIIFSAVLNASSNIARFVDNQTAYNIQLKAPTYLKLEAINHSNRLAQLTGEDEEQVHSRLEALYERIEFVEEDIIPIAHFARAFQLVEQIDGDDLNFVALSIYEDEYLLTGDKKLANGLLSKGYEKVLTFQQLKEKHSIE